MTSEVIVALITGGFGLASAGVGGIIARIPAARAARSSAAAVEGSARVEATLVEHGRMLTILVGGRQVDEEWKARTDERLDDVVESQRACSACPVTRPAPRVGIVPPPSPAPA